MAYYWHQGILYLQIFTILLLLMWMLDQPKDDTKKPTFGIFWGTQSTAEICLLFSNWSKPSRYINTCSFILESLCMAFSNVCFKPLKTYEKIFLIRTMTKLCCFWEQMLPEIKKTCWVTFAQNLGSVNLRERLCSWPFSKSTRDLKSSNTAKKIQEDWKASNAMMT